MSRIGVLFIAVTTYCLIIPSVQSAEPDRPSGQNERPYTINDLLSLEDIGEALVSPDGRFAAIERLRPYDSASQFGLSYTGGKQRSEIVLIDLENLRLKPAKGIKAESAWLGPWSPDGNKLVVYSYDDRKVMIGVWDRKRDRYKSFPGTPELNGFDLGPVQWVSNDDIVYPALGEGKQPYMFAANRQAFESLPRDWQKTWDGIEASHSVLDSGDLIEQRETTARLVRVNTVNGRQRTLIEGEINALSLSPDGKWLAALRFGRPISPKADQAIGRIGELRQREIILVDVTSEASPLTISGEFDAFPMNFVRWSPSGQLLGFRARNPNNPWADIQYFTYSPDDQKLERLKTTGLQTLLQDSGGITVATDLNWLGEKPVLLAAKLSGTTQETPGFPGSGVGMVTPQVPFIWQLDQDAEPQEISLPVPTPVSSMTQYGDALLAFVGGDIWHVRSAKDIGKLNTGLEMPVMAPAISEALSATAKTLPALALSGERPSHAVIDLNNGSNSRILGISPLQAEFQALVNGGTSALYKITDSNGKHVSLVNFTEETAPKPLISVNERISSIQVAEARMLNYSDKVGKPMIGWYLLPPDYEEGKRYPVFTFVYGGAVFGPQGVGPLADLQTSIYLNAQIPASRGYVVLLPSLPIDYDEPNLDIPGQLADSAVAAADSLIELGIADPDRMAVMGQSYGGYSVASIITKTNRFKAAIAAAGVYNLTSAYGQFDPRARQESYPHLRLFLATLMLESQGGMRADPWADPNKYVRNSPLFHADQIETPLLLLHGDGDYVPIQQAEEMFTALVRQGKRARFIKFWGEGHIYSSPANIRQTWDEMFKWLELNM